VNPGRSQARGGTVRRQIILLLQQREARGNQLQPPPTVREIAKAIDRSVASTHRHLSILTELGVIEKGRPGLARTIRLRHERES